MRIQSVDQLMAFVMPGLMLTQALHVAMRLGLPELLATGPKSVPALAQAANADPAALQRLIDVLETAGIVQAGPDGRIWNCPLGELLRADHPQSLRASLLACLSPMFWRPLGELEHSIRTGQPSFDRIFGASFFQYLSEHPEQGTAFAEWMNASSEAVVPAVLRAWDFSRHRKIVDVGGGRGALLAGILGAYPQLLGVLYDQPAVVAQANALRAPALAGRCEIASGSFFDAVPPGGDCYLLRAILHDWDDEKSGIILRNCRAAMNPGSVLLLLETLRDKGSPAEFLDLHMLVLMGGRERSVDEHQSLLRRCGFALANVIRAEGPAILVAVAV